MRRLSLLCLLLLLLALVPGTAHADTITLWCFQDSGNNFVATPTVGTGTYTRGPGVSGSTNFAGNSSQPAACPATGSGKAAAGTDWDSADLNAAISNGDYFDFEVSTASKENITLEFDNQRSSQGPTNWALRYSTDGGSTFNTAGTGTTSDAFGSNPMNTIDLSSISAVNNQTSVVFRIYAWGASSYSGTWRVDNVRIDGQTPTAVTLGNFTAQSSAPMGSETIIAITVLGLAGMGSLWLRRRQR